MNVEKIAAIYELQDHEVKKALLSIGVDHKTAELSLEEMKLFDEVCKLVKEENKSFRDAADIIKKRTKQSKISMVIPAELDPSFKAVLDEQADYIAKKYAGEAPEVIKQQQDLATQYLVKRFWDSMRQIVESGEMKRNFDRVLGSDNLSVMEAEVLPGESPVLPESSTSGT